MTLYQDILMWVSLAAAFALTAAGVVVWCDLRGVLPGRRILHVFMRLPWLVRLFLVAFVVQLVVHGSTKTNQTNSVEGGTTNAPMMTGIVLGGARGRAPNGVVQPEAGRGPYGVASVADADIACGYQMVGASTNAGYSFAMPSNGVLCGHWHQRGAFDDVTCVDFGDWTFPIGSNEVSRLWAFVGGFARPTIRDRVHEIAPVGAPLSAIPLVSRLWMAPTTNDARLVTWENFAIGRIPRAEFETASTNEHLFLNAQIELCPNGDFITRSNDLTRTYRRIDPNDWDGDGWHNDDDPDPKTWTGGDFGFEQALPTNANSDAYCWIDVRASYNTPVVFVGDGESNLSDPSFTALAGQTYRVQLLIGKSYAVTSDQPLVVVARSSSDIEVDGDGTTELSVVYPVDISALEGNGNGFQMRVSPANLGGEFAWTQSCCPITGYGNHYWYAHTGHCTCDGCYAQGHYTYEGYSHDCEGGYCDCPYYCADDPYGTHEDDGPYAASASVSFSSPAVIFEDAYTNRPGLVVARQSTRTTLTCTAHGGEKGITASFSIVGDGKLVRVSGGTLPITRFVPPQQKLEFEIEYEGRLPSESEEDIVVTATMTGEDVQPTTVADELTSVKLELRTVYEAPENPNPTRHLYGVGERVEFEVWPKLEDAMFHVNKEDVTDNATPYDLFEGQATVSASTSRIYRCPAAGTTPDITVSCLGAQYAPTLTVVEPQMVVTPVATGSGLFFPGDVGMGCLTTHNYIGPMTVSFRGIKVFEVPCTNAIPPEGYFATTNFNGQLTHVEGAGWAHLIGDGNYWTTDDAGRDGTYDNWSFGRLIWKIPIGWKRLGFEGDNSLAASDVEYAHRGDRTSRRLLIGNCEDLYTQVFLIDADGTSSVEKFGYRLQRGRWSIMGTVSRISGSGGVQ